MTELNDKLKESQVVSDGESVGTNTGKRTTKEKKKVKKVKSKYRVRWMRLIFKVFLAFFLLVSFGGGYYVYHVLKEVPTVREDALVSDSSSNMYAADGTLIWTSAKYKRNYIEIKDVPKSYLNFLLSTEDADFYTNKGFSPKGLFNAGLSVVKSKLGKGEVRGGSGIEQQLIKLSVFSTHERDRTITRKIKELFLASQLYKNYSKDKILEFYINKIFLGENAYGAQTIANVYFDKNLKDLSLSQQAIIAGLGQAPGAYNLYDNPKLVEERRNEVLLSALNKGKITEKEYKEIKAVPVTEGLVPRNSKAKIVDAETSQHNAFVTSALGQVKALGYDLDATPLQIRTTLNRSTEDQVKAILDTRADLFQDNEHQAAVTITDPKTGQVISEIGGRFSTQIDGLNRATQTNRSSGSSIKPLLDYGPALEYFNWPTNKILNGAPYQYPGTNFIATDYGGVTHGNTSLKTALRMSYNTPALRTLDDVGQTRASEFITKLGLSSKQTLSGSVGLGLDTSTSEMAPAMATFGQGGVYRQRQYVSSVEFSDKSVKEIKFPEVKAMRESTAYVMTSILKGVPDSTGTMPKGAIPGVTQAAKTGTVAYPPTPNIPADGAMDIWDVGYTKSVAVAIWQGYDSPLEDGHYISSYFQLNRAHDLYKEIMTLVSQGKDNSDWTKPATVTKLGGEGLQADYVANDAPTASATKNLTKPESFARPDYGQAVSTDNTRSYKTKLPNLPKVPSDYLEGKWQKDLEAEKAAFNEAHKDDKENAKKVGENE